MSCLFGIMLLFVCGCGKQDISTKNTSSFTAAEQAEIDKFLEVVEREYGRPLEAVDINGKTLIDEVFPKAVAKWDIAVIKYLVVKGANMDMDDTFLEILRERDDRAIGQYLDIISAFSSAPPLHRAATRGQIKEVNALVSKGADVNAQSELFGIPLLAACAGGNLEVVKFLVSKGADVNAKSEPFGTLLLAASAGGNLEVVKFLVSKGADVNAQSFDGITPLHIVVSTGNMDVAKFLISKRADINAKDCRGWTPLDYARSTDMAKYLESVGAKSTNVTITGRVVYDDDGSPLTAGTVLLCTPTMQARGHLDKNGYFNVGTLGDKDGLPPGHYEVAFVGAVDNEDRALLTDKWYSPKTSGMTVEVEKGMKSLEIRVDRNPKLPRK